ncbi:transcriptional regulator, partial [Salmonella sp. 3DZ2-4SM]
MRRPSLHGRTCGVPRNPHPPDPPHNSLYAANRNAFADPRTPRMPPLL